MRRLAFCLLLVLPIGFASAQSEGDVIINEIGNNGTKRDTYQAGDYVELLVLSPAGVRLAGCYLTDLTGATSEGQDKEGAVKFSDAEGSVFRQVIPQGTFIAVCLGEPNERYGDGPVSEDVALDDGNGRLLVFAYSSKPHVEASQGTIVFTGRDNLALLSQWKNDAAIDLVTWEGASRWAGAEATVLTAAALDNGVIASFVPRDDSPAGFRDNSPADCWKSTPLSGRATPGRPNEGVDRSGVIKGMSSVGIRDAAGSGGPRVFLVDPDVLIKGREAFRSGEKLIVPAVKKLLRDAERALAMTPLSVLDKEQVPPSGDKHDYMSMGRYWWPDPSKRNGLPYVRRDGVSNPEAGKITDHDGLSRVIKAVTTLGLAYFFGGEEKYAAQGTRLIRTWFLDSGTRMNPNLNFAQAVPGRSGGRGAGIIDAHQLPELLDGVGLLAGSLAWTPAEQEGLETWVAAYAKWLRESDNGRREAAAKNNHGTWYDVQLCAAALFVRDTSVATATLRDATVKRIAAQIEPDGSQPAELQRTKSWDYSFFNLAAFFRLASLGERLGVDLWHYETADGRSIRKALDWLLPYVSGDQKWSHEQIVDQKTTGIAPLLLQAAGVWKDERYNAVAGTMEGFTETHRALLFFDRR